VSFSSNIAEDTTLIEEIPGFAEGKEYDVGNSF
jgi:hypothetical protein